MNTYRIDVLVGGVTDSAFVHAAGPVKPVSSGHAVSELPLTPIPTQTSEKCISLRKAGEAILRPHPRARIESSLWVEDVPRKQ